MVVGPSGCGKTVFTTILLVDHPDLFETPPKKIYYCYGSWQDGYKRMKQHGIRFHEGIPDSELLPVWFPTRWQEVQDTFRKVTERPFGYMLLDLHPKSSDD